MRESPSGTNPNCGWFGQQEHWCQIFAQKDAKWSNVTMVYPVRMHVRQRFGHPNNDRSDFLQGWTAGGQHRLAAQLAR